MSALTPKEEAFAQAVAAGAKLSDAYRGSRDCSKMATSTINANAKKLARKPAIKARIDELRQRESKESRESSVSEEPTATAELTPKQERFCGLYVEKSNASEAYRLAYDVSPDTKPETVHRKAAELLANGKVTARIEAIRAELRERTAITLDHLVEALRPLAFSDIRKVMTWGDAVPVADPKTGVVIIAQGITIKSITELDDYAAAMIAEISETKDGAKRVKLHDKLAAIEKLAKLLGLIKDQHEHSGSIKVEDLTPRRPSEDRMNEILARYGGGSNWRNAARDAEQARRERLNAEASAKHEARRAKGETRLQDWLGEPGRTAKDAT